MRKWFLFSIILLLPFCGSGQSGNSVINWRKNYKLQWGDFQESDTVLPTPCYTNNHIDFGFKPMKNNILIITISNNFYKKESIKSMKQINTAGIANQLLQQEQLYFDIAEVYARKFRKEIQELAPKTKRKNSNWIIDKGYALQKKNSQECLDEQTLLSEAINYKGLPSFNTGIISESDKKNIDAVLEEWRKRVDDELQSLDSYYNTTITLTVKKHTVM